MKKEDQIPKIDKEKVKKVKKESTFCKAWKKMIYLPDGQFSITRITMILLIIFSLLVGLIGLILSVFTKIKIDPQVYDYAIKLSGGGIIQYIGTKIKDSYDQKTAVKEKEVDKTIPKV